MPHIKCTGIVRSTRGEMMSMGKGALVNIARKYKLNTGSSTKAELVSITDVLGIMMWSTYLMEANGYAIENNILYQDNKSTILLERNGRTRAGKNSKHIKSRFFLNTDKVTMGDIEMNTKTTLGKRFRSMRGHVTTTTWIAGVHPPFFSRR